MLPKPNIHPKFKRGDRVKILNSSMSGRIVELRGPLGPGGSLVYRIRRAPKPTSLYIEVLEEQLELLPKVSKEVDSPKQ